MALRSFYAAITVNCALKNISQESILLTFLKYCTIKCTLPNKHQSLAQCWLNVGQDHKLKTNKHQTLTQCWLNVGQDHKPKTNKHQTLTQCWLIVGQDHKPKTNKHQTLAQCWLNVSQDHKPKTSKHQSLAQCWLYVKPKSQTPDVGPMLALCQPRITHLNRTNTKTLACIPGERQKLQM